MVGVDFDGCLANLYADASVHIRYHSDPDQGLLWRNETCVVSAGATRIFAFRDLAEV